MPGCSSFAHEGVADLKDLAQAIEAIMEPDGNNREDVGAAVVNDGTDALVDRQLVCNLSEFQNLNPAVPAKSKDPRAVFFVKSTFVDEGTMAVVALVIPPGHHKRIKKNSNDNTFVFSVVGGAVEATVANNKVIVSTGGLFIVERNQTYMIKTISTTEAKMWCIQMIS
ncbi:hypothetical protein B0H12DRAFT_1123686 [Mycena haematopus]|nr:hypothetical protein B0H12DRAFT_1123686 [Mycena haematopus]